MSTLPVQGYRTSIHTHKLNKNNTLSGFHHFFLQSVTKRRGPIIMCGFVVTNFAYVTPKHVVGVVDLGIVKSTGGVLLIKSIIKVKLRLKFSLSLSASHDIGAFS